MPIYLSDLYPNDPGPSGASGLQGATGPTPENVVFQTGDQTISGLKDFATRPTVNTIPVALSGEAASNIEQLVKNDYGSTLYKGQPVYVTGSNGNNILVYPASNTGERTSSKTFGLLKQTLLNNEQGYVVTEGGLLNVDTSMAVEGDSIWLGPTGNLIYGLANKPKAPQHLVSLGFVERAHQNQGKIFVKVQNGFELEELHNVRIVNEQNSDIIIYNSGSGLWLNSGVNFGSYYTNNNPSGYITSENVVYTTGNQIISGIKTFIDNIRVSGSGIITNITSGAVLQFSGRNVLTLPDLAQSFRNVYISDTIGDIDGQIGNINRPYLTAQGAWDRIVDDGLFTSNKSYILNFYGGSGNTSYNISVGNSDWPSRVGIRGIGPGNIDLNITHLSPLNDGNGKNFDIKDWGDKSIKLSVVSYGGSWAGGFNTDGGNGGNITLRNCKFEYIESKGGSASPSNARGTFGSIYCENCDGNRISADVGQNGAGLKTQSSNITLINSKGLIINDGVSLDIDISNRNILDINIENSKFESDTIYYLPFTANKISIKNSYDQTINTYHFDTLMSSGRIYRKNLQLTDIGFLSGFLSGIVLTDNLTGRNKLGQRNSAFVADFASGVYLYPFVESPNLVYNTGNQNISGIKIFNSAEIKSSPYYLFSNDGTTLADQVINIANSTTPIIAYLPAVTSGRNYTIKNINIGTVTVTGSNTIDGSGSTSISQHQFVNLLGINSIGYTGWVTI
jgi:hypothetical protein